MRRLTFFAAIFVCCALPAAAQDTAAPDTSAAPATPVPIVSSASPQTASQCRTACAQDYYFCLSGQEASDCYPQWDQCRRACGALDVD